MPRLASPVRPPLALVALGLVVVVAAAIPLLVVVMRAAEAPLTLWRSLWGVLIPQLVLNTVVLTATTMALATALGVSLAWLVERTDVRGRAYWRWLLVLPLGLPAYVTALVYVILLRRGGLIEQTYIAMTGAPRGQLPLPTVYGLAGATIVVSLCVFPYVFLTASAALRSGTRTLEDAARMLGRGPWATFREVTLPAIAPAVAAGALLVGMYVLADFGTVSMLNYRTFTLAIFSQFAGQIDRAGASILSLMLIVLTIPVLLVDSYLGRRDRRYTSSNTWRPPVVVRLGRWRWLAHTYLGVVLTLALLVPLGTLVGLTLQGIFSPTEVDRIWRIGSTTLWGYAGNSVLLAAVSATAATAIALVPTFLAARYWGRLTQWLLLLSKAPYALPGLIVGLGFAFFFNQWMPAVAGTALVLFVGFTFRVLPQAIVTDEAALATVPPSLERAARVGGLGALATFRRVTLVVAAPGLVASWALVFMTAMKELPTAVLLRPPGFDTLPVRIMIAANEAVYTQAAPAACALVLVTMAALSLVLRSGHLAAARSG